MLLIAFLGSIGCNDELVQGEIPPAAFNDIFINLDLPQYSDLQSSGGYISLNEGVRGIILYNNNGQYNAFERNCSYQPYEACATVEMHSSNLFLDCPCCGSNFSLENGSPSGPPASFSLRRYTINQTARTLTITDDPL